MQPPPPGVVEAGGHGGARRKRKGPPRVEKRTANREEHSFLPFFNDTILHVIRWPCRLSNREVRLRPGLSRKRSSSRWGPPFGVVFARRASSLPTAGGDPARARVVSLGGVLFVFARIYRYQSEIFHTRKRVVQK